MGYSWYMTRNWEEMGGGNIDKPSQEEQSDESPEPSARSDTSAAEASSNSSGGGPFADDIAVVNVFWSRPCRHCEQKGDGLGAVCLQ